MTNVINNNSPRIVPAELATEIGLLEAMFLQQVHYFASTDKDTIEGEDGKVWVIKSLNDWSNIFPFISKRTLRRVIDRMVDRGLLKKDNNRGDQNNPLSYRVAYNNLSDDTHLAKSEGMDNVSTPYGQDDHSSMDNASTPPMDRMSTPSSYKESISKDRDQDARVREEDHQPTTTEDEGVSGTDDRREVKVDTMWWNDRVPKYLNLPKKRYHLQFVSDYIREQIMNILKTYDQQQIEEALRITAESANSPGWKYFVAVLEGDNEQDDARWGGMSTKERERQKKIEKIKNHTFIPERYVQNINDRIKEPLTDEQAYYVREAVKVYPNLNLYNAYLEVTRDIYDTNGEVFSAFKDTIYRDHGEMMQPKLEEVVRPYPNRR